MKSRSTRLDKPRSPREKDIAMARRTRRVDPPAHKLSGPAAGAEQGLVAAARSEEAPAAKPAGRPAAEETKAEGPPQFRLGDKLRLTVKEPTERAARRGAESR